MYCPKCGREMKDGARFCPGCGAENKRAAKGDEGVTFAAGGAAKAAASKSIWGTYTLFANSSYVLTIDSSSWGVTVSGQKQYWGNVHATNDESIGGSGYGETWAWLSARSDWGSKGATCLYMAKLTDGGCTLEGVKHIDSSKDAEIRAINGNWIRAN